MTNKTDKTYLLEPAILDAQKLKGIDNTIIEKPQDIVREQMQQLQSTINRLNFNKTQGGSSL